MGTRYRKTASGERRRLNRSKKVWAAAVVICRMLYPSAPQLLLLAAALLACGCREPRAPSYSAASDSNENRLQLARELVQAYPNDQFVRDLTLRLRAILGDEAADDARAKGRLRMSPEAWTEQRVNIYAQLFSTQELALLVELHRSEPGSSLLRKFPQHDDAWRDFLKPLLMESLTNAPVPE